jgi:DNA polymerase beta
MKDYTYLIIQNLEILYKNELLNDNIFKANAYNKVKNNIINHEYPIYYLSDLDNIKGIGKGIYFKLKELFETNKIEKVEIIKKNPLYLLLDIYGIGYKTIKKYNIKNINDLIKIKNILNNNQKIGLKYYKDLQKRIDLKEMKKHHNFINNELKKYDNLTYEFVGSYRRKLKTFGDIDIIIKENKNFDLNNFIDNLIKKKYIIEKLAVGKHKFMGICKIEKISRRIDILIAPENEYSFSLLYFTGSYVFNIMMRKYAKNIGLTLNEHGFNKKINIDFKTEKDIFDYLKLEYVKPENRN